MSTSFDYNLQEGCDCKKKKRGGKWKQPNIICEGQKLKWKMSILGLVVSFILFSLFPLEFEFKFVGERERGLGT